MFGLDYHHPTSLRDFITTYRRTRSRVQVPADRSSYGSRCRIDNCISRLSTRFARRPDDATRVSSRLSRVPAEWEPVLDPTLMASFPDSGVSLPVATIGTSGVQRSPRSCPPNSSWSVTAWEHDWLWPSRWPIPRACADFASSRAIRVRTRRTSSTADTRPARRRRVCHAAVDRVSGGLVSTRHLFVGRRRRRGPRGSSKSRRWIEQYQAPATMLFDCRPT